MIMLTKKSILDTIKKLPNHFSIDDLLDSIILLEKIEIGIEQSKNNTVYSTKQAKKKLNKWLK